MTSWLAGRRRERPPAESLVDDVEGEASLIERLSQGDESALREAYRTHRAAPQEGCLTCPTFSKVLGSKNASARWPFSSKP